jgi:CRP-like cAMP-binding protein
VTSVRPTELLKLDARDFHRLLSRSPELAAAVKEVANQRLSAIQS